MMIFATNASGAVTYVSADWTTATGHPAADAMEDAWLSYAHPADRDDVRSTFLQAIDAQAPFLMCYRLRRADGGYVWVMAEAKPSFVGPGGDLFNGFVGSATPIVDGPAARPTGFGIVDRHDNANARRALAPSVLDLAADHLMIARSMLSADGNRLVLQLVDMALYLIGKTRDGARRHAGSERLQ